MIDSKRLLQAAVLLTVALSAFGLAWMTWSGSEIDCTRPGISDRAIHECVAREAQATEPTSWALVALVLGSIALTAGFILLGKAIRIRRVITLVDAAQQLGIPLGAVRQLVDEGTLDIYEQGLAATYLYPEQVRRYAVESSTEDQPAPA